MIITRRPFRPPTVSIDSAACLLCQWRTFSTSYRHLAQQPSFKKVPANATPTPIVPDSPLADAPRSYGRAVTGFTPKPLGRPIGLPNPPSAGENAGVETRTWKQRRDDFVDYEKHLVRRKELTQKISTPYFREWKNMNLHKGKSFLAPPGIFKADKALYFPNFRGQTLELDKTPKDTTPLLEGMVSVVSVFSSQWAENQAATFVLDKKNPALHETVKNSRGLAQLVQINVEENGLKAWLVRMFMGGLRKKMGTDNWGRYFLVRKGITDELRENVGLLNSKVGYTYVVDEECRIRWAGSGVSEGDENESLVKATTRLVEDLRVRKKKRVVDTTQEEPQLVKGKKDKKSAAHTV